MAAAGSSRPPQTVRRHCRIRGQVQMVGFRAFATLHARQLGLRGWVRNTAAGEVEVLAEGPPAPMAEFLGLLQCGPAAAQVTSFLVSDEVAETGLGDFSPVP